MSPIRRYLRISKYSVLECRIYLDNPSDTRWLLESRDPALPRIFSAIRPLVLPKLREENERVFARKKTKPVKDVIAEDDFEVALFLRESRTRHSLLTRHKLFNGAGHPPEGDAHTEGIINDSPDRRGTAGAGILVESDSDDVDIGGIPEATVNERDGDRTPNSERPSTRRKRKQPSRPLESEPNEDKKLRYRTNYESFNIYGWVLCLLVTRKGSKTQTAPSEPNRQALMEEWISTQVPGDVDEE
ncbi:hypothetical protein PHISCL_10078 [Aspergillus sclerotialis]|uniref:Uncharacterized protein n=1 Tax=Aspergillus sclerotialis TaxID=2070753 RepID=A0A3A2Z3Z6_9EURO|nr:hypothetical protein PHISCL_10078 [Aspergillus sclerotialis]